MQERTRCAGSGEVGDWASRLRLIDRRAGARGGTACGTAEGGGRLTLCRMRSSSSDSSEVGSVAREGEETAGAAPVVAAAAASPCCTLDDATTLPEVQAAPLLTNKQSCEARGCSREASGSGFAQIRKAMLAGGSIQVQGGWVVSRDWCDSTHHKCFSSLLRMVCVKSEVILHPLTSLPPPLSANTLRSLGITPGCCRRASLRQQPPSRRA